MAYHDPELTPAQLATPVEAGLHFAHCDRGVTHVSRVESVFATGWVHMVSVWPTPRARPWRTTTTMIRKYHHPSKAP